MHKRDDTGRFIEQLPMKENVKSVSGSSKENAVRKLNYFWTGLDKNKTMVNLYRAFMEEYEYGGVYDRN